MTFLELEIPGAYVIQAEVISDDRGHYARCWRVEAAAARGLPSQFAQWNRSWSRLAGTLRGLHWQESPHEEGKLILCTKGRIFDVVVDVRLASEGSGRWVGLTLAADDQRMVYVPPGCAHGVLTLEDDCDLIYGSTGAYHAGSERGLRYDDPSIGIRWPAEVRVISAKDSNWPPIAAASGAVGLAGHGPGGADR